MGGRTDALLQDVLEFPDRYSSDLVVLAQELAENRRKLEDLNAQERELLNVGTLDFAQYRPQPQQTQKAPTVTSRPRAAGAKPIEPPPTPEPGVDVPEGASLRPYWWT